MWREYKKNILILIEINNNFFCAYFFIGDIFYMLINKKEDIYKELALFINKLMLDDKYITYDLYKNWHEKHLHN